MVTLLSAILGFIGSMVPDAFAFLRDRSDRLHELKILEMQLAQQAAGHTQRLEEINAQADISEAKYLYKTYNSGIPWVDALNGTVRPVLAYAFFLLYASIKCMQFAMFDFANPLPWQVAALWAHEDQAIFAAIISFYFGQRAMAKLRK